jgi:hypothetical protein
MSWILLDIFKLHWTVLLFTLSLFMLIMGIITFYYLKPYPKVLYVFMKHNNQFITSLISI